MGLFDFLTGGDTSNQPQQQQSSDPTGQYLGNLIDPQTAQQFQQARAQQALLGLSAGLLAGSGPSRLPIPFGSALGQGLLGMMQQQNALPGQALQAAQTQGQIGDAQYKKLQGLGLLQNMQFLNQQAKAAQDAYTSGGNASATPAGGTVSPTNSSAPSLSGDYADKVIGVESGGNPNAKNPRSSATGPGGFIDSTWLDLYRKTHPGAASIGDDASLLALRTDPQTAKGMIDAYGAENTPILAQAGIPINDATLYSAHFLGPDGAVKVLTAPASTPLANLLSPKVMSANPNLKGKTAADFASMMSSKMGVNTGSGGSMPPGVPGSPATVGGSSAAGPPVQLASMNGSAGPENAAFLAKAFGGQGQAAAPGGLQTSSMAAPPGVNAPQVGGSMPLPPGMTPAQVNAARLSNSFAALRGGTPDPYLAKIGVYGPEAALAAANAEAAERAKAGTAGQTAFNTALGNQAAGNGPMVDAVVNGVEMKVPQQDYIAMLRQYGPGAVQGGTPSTSPTVQGGAPQPAPMPRQAMPGTNLMPGGGAPGIQPQRGSLLPPGAPLVPSGGNAGPTASPTPVASVAPQSGGNPMIGKPYVNPLYQKGVDTALSQDSDRMTKVLIPEADKAVEMINSATLIRDLLPQIRTGWNADTMQSAAKVLAAIGVDDKTVQSFTGMDPTAGDAITKVFLQQSTNAVRAMGAREPGSVIALFGKAYPSLLTQKDAITLMENVFEMQARWAQDRLAGAQQHQNQQLENLRNNQPYTPLTTFETTFNKGPNNAQLYLKAAEAMSGMGDKAWKGMNASQQSAIYALIPQGASYARPDGRLVPKG